MFTDELAVQFVTAAFVILIVLFVILVGYSVIQRFLSARAAEALETAETYIQKHLYLYLDSDITIKDFADAIRDKYDIVAAYRLINPMIDNLKGEERNRLKNLLELPKFKRYYKNKLKSKKPLDLAHACSFFAQKHLDDKKVEVQLFKLQLNEYSVLAYSATLALLSSSDQIVRNKAVEVFLNRKLNSSMAINDVVYKFYNSHKSQMECGDFLMRLASTSYIPLSTGAAVVRTFPEFGFFDQMEHIFELLKNPSRYDYIGIWTSSLIDVLDEFSHPKMKEFISTSTHSSSIFQRVRLSCAKWFVRHYEPNYREQVLALANDTDLEIRFIAQQLLISKDESDNVINNILPQYQSEFLAIQNAGDYERTGL